MILTSYLQINPHLKLSLSFSSDIPFARKGISSSFGRVSLTCLSSFDLLDFLVFFVLMPVWTSSWSCPYPLC